MSFRNGDINLTNCSYLLLDMSVRQDICDEVNTRAHLRDASKGIYVFKVDQWYSQAETSKR